MSRSKAEAEAAAYVLLIALEDSFRRAHALGDNHFASVSGTAEVTNIAHIAWTFHANRRLSGRVYPRVLTIKGIELHEKLRGRGICTSMIHKIIEGSVGGPSIPLAYLHFQECGEGLSRLLEREHFHRYELGCAVDWWRPINGQKELAL